MPKLVCPHCQQKVRIPSVNLNALANPAGVAKVPCPECKGRLVVAVPRTAQGSASESSMTISTVSTAELGGSGIHLRVRRGHIENFRRKLVSAESREQLERVISTVEVAVARNMIEANDSESLTELIQRRRQDLKQ